MSGTVSIPKERLDALAQIVTITHVDGKPIPPSRVLAWIETNVVKLGAQASMKTHGRFTAEEFAALDVHGRWGS